MRRAKGRKNTNKKKNTNNPFLVTVFVILIAIFAAVIGYNLWVNTQKGNSALIPVDEKDGKVNILLLGVDGGGLRTDTMMLVSYDFKKSSANIMSIPRDTKMTVSDRKVTRKINEIHAMTGDNKKPIGAIGSVKAVSALTGMPVHYYIEFNFDAIDEIADILGPVKFTVPDIEGSGKGMNYDDPAQDLHIHLKPGLQELTGNEIQQFLRYRKSNNGKSSGSDLDRVKRQQELIKAIIDQKLNMKLINKLPSIYSELSNNIQTNMSLADIAYYSKYLKDFDADNISSFSYPGESKSLKSGWYFVADFDEAAKIIQNDFGYEKISADNLSDSITVSGVYGTGNILKSDKKQTTDSTISDDDEDSSKINESIKEDKETESDDNEDENILEKNSEDSTDKSSEKDSSNKSDTSKKDNDEPEKEDTKTSDSDTDSSENSSKTDKPDVEDEDNSTEDEDEYIMLD